MLAPNASPAVEAEANTAHMEKPRVDGHYSLLRFLAGRLLAFLAAVGVAYVLATLSATQSVVRRLEGMGVAVPLAERASMSLQDLAGMAASFLPLIAFGLLIALLCAALISRQMARQTALRASGLLPAGRGVLYFLAGAAALVCVHWLMSLALGITPVAIARTAGGLAIQAVAGGVGGLAYIGLARRLARG